MRESHVVQYQWLNITRWSPVQPSRAAADRLAKSLRKRPEARRVCVLNLREATEAAR